MNFQKVFEIFNNPSCLEAHPSVACDIKGLANTDLIKIMITLFIYSYKVLHKQIREKTLNV